MESAARRDALINTRAMASTGTVFVLLLTACIVFELVRGNDPSPYTYLMAAGGASYAVALLVLRRRS
jgi:Na+/melibiose symporter-like transporter